MVGINSHNLNQMWYSIYKPTITSSLTEHSASYKSYKGIIVGYLHNINVIQNQYLSYKLIKKLHI